MTQFPRTEHQVIMLAQDISAGLVANVAIYPVPPAGIAIESEITLTNQERGKDREHCVSVVNKASEGKPGMAVL